MRRKFVNKTSIIEEVQSSRFDDNFLLEAYVNTFEGYSGAGDIIGTYFKFVSNFTATGQEVICADTTNEIIVGALINSDTDDDNSTKAWNAEVADAFSSVEFTGVPEGAIGSYFTLLNYAADRWLIDGVVIPEGGSEATPFAAS